MDKILKSFFTPTARSSAIYYFGNFILSFSRYIFHLILLRLLVPAEYGEFLSYLSLTYLLGVPTSTIGTIVTKFVSDYKGKGDDTSINQFFYFLLKLISPIALFLGLALIILSSPLAIVFKAHSMAFIVLGISFFISLFQTIINSYIIAFQKFIFQTIVGFGGVIITILLSVIFIKMGLGATGAVLGQILAGIITSFILFLSIRRSIIPRNKQGRDKNFNLIGFTGYSFIFALGTASLISSDVLIVRALFDSHTSGLYSSLSILGRMIYYGLTPFGALVLPIAAHRHAQKGSTRSVFFKLGAVIFSFGMLGAGIFSLFPVQIISLLSGSAYLEAAPYLPYFAFTMAFFAFSQFIISYLMATDRPQANKLLLTVTLLQPICFFLFRGSLSGVIFVNFILQLVLFISLCLFLLTQRHSGSKHI